MPLKKTFRINDVSQSIHKKLPIRYVCRDCLTTFKDEIYIPTEVCWECGGEMIAIEKNRGIISDE